jgi:hypothetical protein
MSQNALLNYFQDYATYYDPEFTTYRDLDDVLSLPKPVAKTEDGEFVYPEELLGQACPWPEPEEEF